jgi:hypothetical protein
MNATRNKFSPEFRDRAVTPSSFSMALIGQGERTGVAPATSPLPCLGSVKGGSAAPGTHR